MTKRLFAFSLLNQSFICYNNDDDDDNLYYYFYYYYYYYYIYVYFLSSAYKIENYVLKATCCCNFNLMSNCNQTNIHFATHFQCKMLS